MIDLKSLFKTGAKDVIKATGEVLDNLITNKEEREAAKLAIQAEINRHQEAQQAAANEIEKAYLEDKANARTRETDFVKATGHIDWMQTVVGTLVMLTFIGALLLIGFKELPKGSEHLMINAIGIMEGLVLSVVGYYYGSSAGSRIKDMKNK